MVGKVLSSYLLFAMSSLCLAYAYRLSLPPNASSTEFLLASYRQTIGVLDGRPCPSWPTCSAYAQHAIHDYGVLQGSWLMLDRLIHEHDDWYQQRQLLIDREARIDDPLWRNTFWLTRMSSDTRAE